MINPLSEKRNVSLISGAYLSFFLFVAFFRTMSGLIVFSIKSAVLITNVTILQQNTIL